MHGTGTTSERDCARRWVAHVDMDAFFASVEQLDNPALAGRPLIVGNSPLPMERLRELAAEAHALRRTPEFIKGVRGVVASASYEARAFGVRSAMPLARALVLCPDAQIVPGRFERYREVAGTLRNIWSEFSPVVEPMSLDEAYLDLTGAELSQGPVRGLGERLKSRIRETTRLTASVGIAPNRLVAKIASDLQKPDGLVVVDYGEEADILAPMHVRALPGIGPRTAGVLESLGIKTLGQLALASERFLASRFGLEHARSLRQRAAGVDDTPVQVPGDPKSISNETTLAEDESDIAKLQALLRGLSDNVAWTLRKEGFCTRCVYIKLRLLPVKKRWTPEDSGFGRLITRQRTLPVPTNVGQVVYDAACNLLQGVFAASGLSLGSEVVRLIGVGVASLVHDSALDANAADPKNSTSRTRGQPGTLFDLPSEATSKRERPHLLDSSMDEIRRRFGFDAISYGNSLVMRDVDDSWRAVDMPGVGPGAKEQEAE